MKCKTRWCYFNLLIHKILQKDAQKGDFWNSLDPFLGFILKTVPGIHDPRISGLPFGTKNHEMRGPPVVLFFLLPAPIKKTWKEPHAFHTKLCSKTQIDFVAHPKDCSKYLVCHGFKGFVIQCPEGQLFDKFEKICNPAAEVMCQNELDERSAKRLV